MEFQVRINSIMCAPGVDAEGRETDKTQYTVNVSASPDNKPDAHTNMYAILPVDSFTAKDLMSKVGSVVKMTISF